MTDDDTTPLVDGSCDQQTDAELRAQWESVDPDPDLEEDLGYEPLDLDVIKTSSPTPKLMVLPRDEDLIEDDAFIVLDPEVMR